MDKQIQKLKNPVQTHLHQSKAGLRNSLGDPLRFSDDYIWFYRHTYWLFFRDEISFIFEEDKVIDICVTEYFCGLSSTIFSFMKIKTPNIQ